MAKGIYVTNAEPMGGKSVVVFGLLELLRHHVDRVGIFIPVLKDPKVNKQTSADSDSQRATDEIGASPYEVDLCERYQIDPLCETSFGVTHDEAREAIANGRSRELTKKIMARYRQLESRCDSVLSIGTDFRGVTTPLEFDFNVDLAKNLGSLLVPVIRGHQRTINDIDEAMASIADGLNRRDCELLAVIVNRVDHSILPIAKEALTSKTYFKKRTPVYIIENSPSLDHPTIKELADAIGAKMAYGTSDGEDREVAHYKIAGMEFPHLLEHIQPGTLVIAAGDRSDIVLGSLLLDSATDFPRIAGLILTGDLTPPKNITELILGSNKNNLPILKVTMDTFDTAVKVSQYQSILTPKNKRKIETALGLFENSVDIPNLKKQLDLQRPLKTTPLMFEHDLIQFAKKQRKKIVLPEGEEPRILKAAELLCLRQVCDLVLLGDPSIIQQKILDLGLKLDRVRIINPLTSPKRQQFAENYYQLRKHKGVTHDSAFEVMSDPSYFGTMMVHLGLADGMVSGSINTTQHTIRPALEFIKTVADASVVSSVFFMCLADRVLVFGDCAVNPDPNEKQLAEIAVTSAKTARSFGIDPKVALLSYSTGTSGKGEDVEKVRAATELARKWCPDLKIEGPLQFDAAYDPEVAKIKMPESQIAGQATVFIFPDLNTGNNTYKAVQRSANAVAIGPVLQGLKKPINDLSRGCTVADIFNTVTITAIQAQSLQN